jgi:phage baseplate assembly protein W
MAGEFIGSGWGFPLSTTATGSIALVTGNKEIEQAIRLILSTAMGERPMRPEFGCGIHDHVFASADATTAGLISYEVKRALARWEPRITVSDVVVSIDSTTKSTMYIDVRYSVRGDNDRRNLVFPFYLIPEEG